MAVVGNKPPRQLQAESARRFEPWYRRPAAPTGRWVKTPRPWPASTTCSGSTMSHNVIVTVHVVTAHVQLQCHAYDNVMTLYRYNVMALY